MESAELHRSIVVGVESIGCKGLTQAETRDRHLVAEVRDLVRLSKPYLVVQHVLRGAKPGQVESVA